MGCDNVCEYNKTAASCRFRIQWAANHRFLGQPNACSLAHEFVLQQCPVCSDCRATATGCEAQAATIALQETTTHAAYDCHDTGVAWTAVKTKWCCRYINIGCDWTTTSMEYNCEAGYTHWQLGWSVSKKEWCCEHLNLGCPSTSIRGSHNLV